MILFPDAVEGVVVRAQHVHDSTKGHDRRLATVFLHDETYMRLDCKEMMESLVEDDVAAIWQGCAGGPLKAIWKEKAVTIRNGKGHLDHMQQEDQGSAKPRPSKHP